MNYFEEQKLRLQSNEVISMYDIVINILYKFSNNLYESDNFDSIFTNYMLCRFLSMIPKTFKYAEYLSVISSTSNLSKKQFYQLAYNLIPKQNKVFLKYIKKPQKIEKKKPNIINNKNEIVTNIMEL